MILLVLYGYAVITGRGFHGEEAGGTGSTARNERH